MEAATGFLDKLVGHWQLEGQMGDVPLRQSVEGKWTLGGLFVELYFKSTLPAPDGQKPYEAVYYVGYNAENAVYVLHLLDTFGVAQSCTVGLGQKEGDSIPFVFDYGGGPFTNRFTWDATKSEWSFELTDWREGRARSFATKRMVRRH